MKSRIPRNAGLRYSAGNVKSKMQSWGLRKERSGIHGQLAKIGQKAICIEVVGALVFDLGLADMSWPRFAWRAKRTFFLEAYP